MKAESEEEKGEQFVSFKVLCCKKELFVLDIKGNG